MPNKKIVTSKVTAPNKNFLADKIDGKLMAKIDIGYVYGFGGTWVKSNADANNGANKSIGSSGVGYGVSLGYTNRSGWGISTDYLAFNHKWTGHGTGENSGNQYNYDASYHVVTFTPNYRFKLDQANNWGLRIGVGLGFSVSDIAWARALSSASGTSLANGASYKSRDSRTLDDPSSGISNSLNACPNNFSEVVTDSNGGPGQPGNRCLNAGGGLFSGTSDYQIATLLKDNNIAQADLRPLAGVSGSDSNIKPGSKIIFNGVISTAIINSCVWGQVNGCYLSDGSQYATTGSVGKDTPSANPQGNPADKTAGGKAKDDAGFVVAPQIAIEYDNGMLHADINARYLHGLKDVKYFGSEGLVDTGKSAGQITYTARAGALAFFIGAGLGLNF